LKLNKMPASKRTSQHRPLRDAWLPRPAFLQPSTAHDNAEIEELDLSHIDENPLIYFLNPTPSSYGPEDDDGLGGGGGGGDMDFDMEFDAGIEDAKHPPPIVRSVSPSSLGGLSRPPTPPRSPATPDLESDLSATPDDDNDHEQYDYMAVSSSWLPRRFKDKFRARLEPAVAAYSSPPRSPPPGAAMSRGRAVTRPGGGSFSTSGRRVKPARLSPHAWREPSPDVWAIEEETAEEMGEGSEMEQSGMGGDFGFVAGEEGEAVSMARAVDIPAAKPQKKNSKTKTKKRVRFALPALEDDGRGVH
jgi:hypothetical protein